MIRISVFISTVLSRLLVLHYQDYVVSQYISRKVCTARTHGIAPLEFSSVLGLWLSNSKALTLYFGWVSERANKSLDLSVGPIRIWDWIGRLNRNLEDIWDLALSRAATRTSEDIVFGRPSPGFRRIVRLSCAIQQTLELPTLHPPQTALYPGLNSLGVFSDIGLDCRGAESTIRSSSLKHPAIQSLGLVVLVRFAQFSFIV